MRKTKTKPENSFWKKDAIKPAFKRKILGSGEHSLQLILPMLNYSLNFAYEDISVEQILVTCIYLKSK